MIIPPLAHWFRPPLLLSLSLGLGVAAGALAEETPAQAMAHAIARMMEGMGFNDAANGARPPVHPMVSGPDGWPSAFGPWPATGVVQSGMSDMPRMAERVYQGMTASDRGAGSDWAPGPLEGVWEDSQGGLLVVQGVLYRLYSACDGHIDGDIRILGDRVELANRQQNFIQGFQYALDQGRLALRDPNGQIFLYRRLRLGP